MKGRYKGAFSEKIKQIYFYKKALDELESYQINLFIPRSLVCIGLSQKVIFLSRLLDN